MSTSTEKKISKSALQSMKQDANEYGVQFTTDRLSSLLHKEEEKDLVQVITCDDLVRNVADLPELTDLDYDEESNEDSEEFYSVDKQFISIKIAKGAL